MVRPAVLCLLCAGAPALAQTCEPQWLPGEGVPGIAGTVRTFVMWDPDGAGPAQDALVAAGAFTVAGNAIANSVAVWRNEDWRVLGDGLTLENPTRPAVVYAVAVWHGDLIAAGRFERSGAEPISTVAKWNGTKWESLGPDLQVDPRAIVVYNDEVIVGGNGLWRFDGSAWASVVGAPARDIDALAVTPQGLHVLHDTRFVNRWNGSQWVQFNALSQSQAAATLGVFQDELYVGGTGVRRAVNLSWEYIAAFLGVYALEPFGDALVAGGSFNSPPSGALLSQRVGNTWSPLGPLDVTAYRVRALRSDTTGGLAVGGTMLRGVNGLVANGVARWDRTAWTSYAPKSYGLDAPISAFTEFEGALIAGGYFSGDSRQAIHSVGHWNGSSWQPVGDGLESVPVIALTVHGNSLVAAADDHTVYRWDGNAWASLGEPIMGNIATVASHGGNLFAGGAESASAPVSRRGIALWSGSEWVGLTSAGTNGEVMSLVSHSTGLVAGGHFTSVGGKAANHVAVWNETWSPMGAGLAEGILALTVYQGDVVAGGSWGAVARWNGAAWTQVGSAFDGPVRALAARGNMLVTAGMFDNVGGHPVNRIAVWNGTVWEGLGLGIQGASILNATGEVPRPAVWALAIHDDQIVVGGSFGLAGGSVSANFARFGCEPASCYADCDGDGSLNTSDFGCFQTTFALGDPYADCDGDTALTLADFGCFQTSFAVGCP